MCNFDDHVEDNWAPAYIHHYSVQASYYQRVFPAVFQWCTSHHFVVRLYSQHVAIQIWEQMTALGLGDLLHEFRAFSSSIALMKKTGWARPSNKLYTSCMNTHLLYDHNDIWYSDGEEVVTRALRSVIISSNYNYIYLLALEFLKTIYTCYVLWNAYYSAFSSPLCNTCCNLSLTVGTWPSLVRSYKIMSCFPLSKWKPTSVLRFVRAFEWAHGRQKIL